MTEEQELERRRNERRQQMKMEKRRQQKRRQQMKRMIPFLVAAFLMVVLIIVGIVSGIKAIVRHSEEKKIEVERMKEEEERALLALTPTPEPEPVKKVIAGMGDLKIQLPEMIEGYEMVRDGATSNISEEDVQSTYASLINATTGQVIISKNGNDRMNPASMTKLMTVLVAAENIDNLDDLVTVTIEDTDYAYVHDLSIAGFEAGETVPVRDLFYGAILPSGGECCHALETYVAGSHEEFIAMMNAKADELGIGATTHFTNSAGLYDENHYTTLYDISMIMKAAIENDWVRQVIYEHIYTTTSTDQHPQGLELSNWFLRRIEDKYDASEVMGAKTGYVFQSGNCAVSYTVVNGQTFICATGMAHSGWRAIFDHVYMYNNYTK